MRALQLHLAAILIIAGAPFSFGQQPKIELSPRETKPVDSPALTANDDQYRIGPGDILEIRVFNRPQLSRDVVRVDGHGLIEMPLLDEGIGAACKTESELAHDIETRYLRYQRNPHVSVFVKEFNSQPVAVIGAVVQPGRFHLQRRIRLLELLTFAGGPTERAGERVNLIRASETMCSATNVAPNRGGSAQPDLISFRLSDILKGDNAANPYLEPGDIISMSEAEQAYVVGNVFKPTTINLKEPVTVMRAIAIAGGVMPDTKLNRIRIIRQPQPGSAEREIFVDLSAGQNQRTENIVLEPGDIVDVGTSGGKRFLRNLFSAFAPALANAPVRVVR